MICGVEFAAAVYRCWCNAVPLTIGQKTQRHLRLRCCCRKIEIGGGGFKLVLNWFKFGEISCMWRVCCLTETASRVLYRREIIYSERWWTRNLYTVWRAEREGEQEERIEKGFELIRKSIVNEFERTSRISFTDRRKVNRVAVGQPKKKFGKLF